MPEPTAVDQLADSFWERFKELSPISATINGDPRYDDKLPDPSPEGRAKARRFAEDMRDAANAISEDGLSVEDRITRDVLRVIGNIFIVQDDQRIDTLQVVDQMGGPQQLLPQLCQFQTADTPERLELFLGRLHAYPKYMADNIELAARGAGERPDRAAHRRRAHDRAARADARHADRAGGRAVARDGRQRGRSRGDSRRHPRRGPAGDRAFLEAIKGDYLAATRPRERPLVGAQRRRAVPNADPALDDARPRPAGGPRHRPRPAPSRSRTSAGRSRMPPGFGDDTVAYRASLAGDADEPGEVAGAPDRPRDRRHRARLRARPARCSGAPRSPSAG